MVTRVMLLVLGFSLLTVSHANAGVGCLGRSTLINNSGSGADITIDGTTGGVVVKAAAAKEQSCGGVIKNSGANPMRCGPDNGPNAITVSSTVGFPLASGESYVFGPEATTEEWKCIRTTGSSTAAAVAESR